MVGTPLQRKPAYAQLSRDRPQLPAREQPQGRSNHTAQAGHAWLMTPRGVGESHGTQPWTAVYNASRQNADTTSLQALCGWTYRRDGEVSEVGDGEHTRETVASAISCSCGLSCGGQVDAVVQRRAVMPALRPERRQCRQPLLIPSRDLVTAAPGQVVADRGS